MGADGATGLNNVHMLIKTWGKVINPTASQWRMNIDDGTGELNGEALSVSVPVLSAAVIDPDWEYAQVTAPVRLINDGGVVKRFLDCGLQKNLIGYPFESYDWEFFPDFSGDSTDIVMNGTAGYVTDSTNTDNTRRLRLNSNAQREHGAAWKSDKVNVANGFTTKFAAQTSGNQPGGAGDYVEFVVQGVGNVYNPAGDDTHYNCLAVRLQTWVDRAPNANTACTLVLAAYDFFGQETILAQADMTNLEPNIKTNRPQLVKVVYANGAMNIRVNGSDLISTPVDLGAYGITDESGTAWVGFAGSTGDAVENHDITFWRFRSGL